MPPKIITSKTACWFLRKPIIASAVIAARAGAGTARTGLKRKLRTVGVLRDRAPLIHLQPGVPEPFDSQLAPQEFQP